MYKVLLAAREALKDGERDFVKLSEHANAKLVEGGFKPDYFNIANPKTLAPSAPKDEQFVILVAAYLGKTRLIDNITLALN